jgi:transcriptional regulator with XRE-family HTH domain/shikimate kinase
VSDSQSSPRDLDRQPEQEAARQARQRWQQLVAQALVERRMSINAAAKEMGISPGRLQAWLNQDVEPSPRVMGKLAEVLGLGHLHLLEVLGWLPAQLGNVPLRLEASTRLHDAVAQAERLLYAADETAGGPAVAEAVLNSSNDWDARLCNVTAGRRYPVRYSTLLGFSPAQTRPSDAAVDTAADRREITALAQQAIERTSSRWLTQEEVRAHGDAFARADLVLSSPVLGAARPRGIHPELNIPASIAVLGIPGFGAREVGALVADALDWAFFDLTHEMGQMYGYSLEEYPPGRNPAHIQMVRRLLREADQEMGPVVFSWDEPTSVRETFREIGEDSPLVVFLRAPDSMLEYAFRRFSADVGQAAADELEIAQNVVRRTLENRRDRDTYLRLDLPELSPARDADDLFDAYVELAFEITDWLSKKHGARKLSDTSGILNQLKPSQGG